MLRQWSHRKEALACKPKRLARRRAQRLVERMTLRPKLSLPRCAFDRAVLRVGIIVLLAFGLAVQPTIAQVRTTTPMPAASVDEPAFEHVSAATRFIEGLAARVIDALIEDGLSTDERRQQFRDLVDENIAVNGIARFVLGRHWRRASKAEREEYMRLFREVIITGWADRLFVAVARPGDATWPSRDMIKVTGSVPVQTARAGQRTALVHSLISIPEGPPLRVTWRVANEGKVFKLTDFLVEGISLAQTQRDEIASVIRHHGGKVGGLLAVLREKRDQDLALARID